MIILFSTLKLRKKKIQANAVGQVNHKNDFSTSENFLLILSLYIFFFVVQKHQHSPPL